MLSHFLSLSDLLTEPKDQYWSERVVGLGKCSVWTSVELVYSALEATIPSTYKYALGIAASPIGNEIIRATWSDSSVVYDCLEN